MRGRWAARLGAGVAVSAAVGLWGAAASAVAGTDASPIIWRSGETVVEKFLYVGHPQFLRLPNGVSAVEIYAVGAPGGSSYDADPGDGGVGGTVQGTYEQMLAGTGTATSAQLEVTIGGKGGSPSSSGGASFGGYNGGAAGAPGAGGGGGASGVELLGPTANTALAVAGGGGGGGNTFGTTDAPFGGDSYGGAGNIPGIQGVAAEGSDASGGQEYVVGAPGGGPGNHGPGVGGNRPSDPDCDAAWFSHGFNGGSPGSVADSDIYGQGGLGGGPGTPDAGGGGGGGYYGGGGGAGAALDTTCGTRAGWTPLQPGSGGGGGGGSYIGPADPGASLGYGQGSQLGSVTVTYTKEPVLTTSGQLHARATIVGHDRSVGTERIRNAGSAPLAITGVEIAGSGRRNFMVRSDNCQKPVGAGRSCSVSVEFAPKSEGQHTAQLILASNDQDSPLELTLRGRGLVAKHAS
jgi:hypothetical protein